MIVEMPIESARDRLLLLNSMPNLSGLDESAIQLLAERTRLCRFEEGTVLLEGETKKNSTYLITQGSVDVYHNGKFMTRVDAPGGVGIIAVLAGDTYPIHAVAKTQVIALEISVDLLLDSFEENFSALRNSLRLLSRQLMAQRGSLPVRPEDASQPELGTFRDEPLSSVELILRVSDAGIFSGKNLDAVIDITRGMTERRLKKGDVLWELGAPASEFIRIDYGHVRCTNDSKEHVTVGADFVLGVVDTLAATPYSFEARAETDVIIFVTRRDVLLGTLETHFDLARALLAVQASAVLRGMTAEAARSARGAAIAQGS